MNVVAVGNVVLFLERHDTGYFEDGSEWKEVARVELVSPEAAQEAATDAKRQLGLMTFMEIAELDA